MQEAPLLFYPSVFKVRIDHYLSEEFPDLSRSYIQKLIKEGCILVDDSIVKSSHLLMGTECIAVCMPVLKEPDILPQNIELDILYEDESILIVNKPKNMVVHPAVGHYDGTLVNALMYHCKEELSGIGGVMRPGIVHRIDRNTTGSLIVCKTDMAHKKISAQLQEHSIQRIYHAIVCGNLKEDEGTIDRPIGRHPKDRKKMSVNLKNGKPAVTHYKVLERFGTHTYIQCQLETGRTHQIRVHMASIHHPILGDDVYGSVNTKWKLLGQTLHAKTLGFVHPITETYLEVDAPIPTYFIFLLERLRKLG